MLEPCLDRLRLGSHDRLHVSHQWTGAPSLPGAWLLTSSVANKTVWLVVTSRNALSYSMHTTSYTYLGTVASTSTYPEPSSLFPFTAVLIGLQNGHSCWPMAISAPLSRRPNMAVGTCSSSFWKAPDAVQLRFSLLLLILLPGQDNILVHSLKPDFLVLHFLAGSPSTPAIRQESRRDWSQTETRKKKYLTGVQAFHFNLLTSKRLRDKQWR